MAFWLRLRLNVIISSRGFVKFYRITLRMIMIFEQAKTRLLFQYDFYNKFIINLWITDKEHP